MRLILSALALAGCAPEPPLRCGDVLWTRTIAEHINSEWPKALAATDDGFVVAGWYGRDAVFEGGDAPDVTLSAPCPPDTDAFVAKYDWAGNLQWAHAAGDCGLGAYHAVAAAPDGRVVAAGFYSGTLGSFDLPALTGRFTASPLIAVFARDGTPVWQATATADRTPRSEAVTFMSDGGVVATGTFSGDTITFPTATLTNQYEDYANVWVAAWAADGTPRWATHIGGGQVWGVAEVGGTLVVTGTYNTHSGLTPEPQNTLLSGAFIAGLSPATGEILWLHTPPGARDRSALRAHEGEAWWLVTALGTASFGPPPPGDTRLSWDDPTTSRVDFGTMLVRYDAAGNYLGGEFLFTDGFVQSLDFSGDTAVFGLNLNGHSQTNDYAVIGPTLDGELRYPPWESPNGTPESSALVYSPEYTLQCGWGGAGEAAIAAPDGGVIAVEGYEHHTTVGRGTPSHVRLEGVEDAVIVRYGGPTRAPKRPE